MDYTKLMAQLEAEVNLGLGVESSPKPSVKNRKAYESFDSIEAELAESMGYNPSATESEEEPEDELIFEEEGVVPEAEEPGNEEEETPMEILKESIRAAYLDLSEQGEKDPAGTIRTLIDEVLGEFDDSEETEIAEEGCIDKNTAAAEEDMAGEINKTSQPAEEVKAHTVATEAAGKGSIVERLKALGGISSATESAKPKYSFRGRKKTAEESTKAKEDPKAALESMGEERLSKAINRYVELAKGNKGTGSIYSVTESMGEKQINLNDHCLGRACVEYGYTRDNLKQAVVESIQKGVI